MLSRTWGTLVGLVAVASLGFAVGCGDDGGSDPAPATAGSGGSSAGGSGGSGGAAAGSGGAAAGSGGSVDEAKCKTEDTCAEFKTKDGAAPPAKPADAPSTGDDLIHGVSKLYVGDTDRDGNASEEAWKKIGFDLDGWNSTPKQGFHCQPVKGATPSSIRQDGEGGIDNAFGKTIVNEILLPLVSAPTDEISKSITEGSFSVLLKMSALGTTADGTGVKTQLFAAAGTKDGDKYKAPGDDWSAYEWHPFPEILEADGKSSKVKFDNAYIAKNVWVSGDKGTLNLSLSIQGFTLSLDIQRAQIAVDLTDRKAGKNGTIAGILETEALVGALTKVAGNLSSDFCNGGGALDGILEQVRQASDIMADGTQNPDQTCSGISIGLGFDSKVTKIGDAAPKSEAKDPCAK